MEICSVSVVSLLIAATAEVCSAKGLEFDAFTDAFSWEG
jgi:hypothetical protein